MEIHLYETGLLNYNHPVLVRLVREREWKNFSKFEKIGSVYDFVQNEIVFGYNVADDIPASKVLQDGYGQCNTKGSLLMALLRAVGIPCRLHGFTIHKKLQKGAVPGLAYHLAPQDIIHSWVEVYYQNRWIHLEGFILDKKYLTNLQSMFNNTQGNFCGYGVAVSDFQSPLIDWKGEHTYIQKEGINRDFGVFDSPDTFYKTHGTNLSGVNKILYRHFFRKLANRKVKTIRAGIQP